MTSRQIASREDVLKAFAVEANDGREVLVRYLTEFPQYAQDLVDLSRELARSNPDDAPLSEQDDLSVESAMARFRRGEAALVDLTKAAPQRFVAAAERLQMPLQAMVAFRERRVDLTSVPIQFVKRMARALQTTVDQLQTFLELPPQVSVSRSNKSSVKPVAAVKVTFEKVLLDAGLPPERVSEFMTREE